jgi:hypothetical protein
LFTFQAVNIANLATSIVLISTSIIPISLALRMKLPELSSLRRGVRVSQVSTLLLGLFLLMHGLYHVSEFIGNDFFSDDILEPLTIVFLLSLSLYVKKFIFVPKTRHDSPKELKISEKRIKNSEPFLKAGRTLLVTFPVLAVFTTLVDPIIQNPAEAFTLTGILISASLFAWMAIKNPSFRSLHFDFAIIVLIWAAAEIPHSLSTFGFLNIAGIDLFGTWVHFISMLFIGLFVSLRTIKIVFYSPGRIHTKVNEAI